MTSDNETKLTDNKTQLKNTLKRKSSNEKKQKNNKKKKVVQWDLSKMLSETKSQKTSKSKSRNREKKLSSQIISTKQTSEIHDFLPKIKSEPQKKSI